MCVERKCTFRAKKCKLENYPRSAAVIRFGGKPAERGQTVSENPEDYRVSFGSTPCLRCNAKSKRSGQRCKAPAIKGKSKCRTHGGMSTGPRTAEGRARCAKAKTIHGQDTRSMRAQRSATLAELQELEALAFDLGMMTGSRTRGPKVRQKEF